MFTRCIRTITALTLTVLASTVLIAGIASASTSAPAAASHAQNLAAGPATVTAKTVTLAVSAASTPAGVTVDSSANGPFYNVGYGCLVEVWPGTNDHPCGFVLSNPVSQGIANAFQIVGTGAGISACTTALTAFHVPAATAGTICAAAAAWINKQLGTFGTNRCLFIITTPSYLQGQVTAVNC